MQKSVLLLAILVMLTISSSFSQTLNDYISAVRGDTLVIKDYDEMNNTPNSLYNALLLDTVNVPSGRVYMLKVNGFYPQDHEINLSTTRAVTIVGEDNTILVNNKNAKSAPPVLCAELCTCDPGFPFDITVNKSLSIKNCNIIPRASDGTIGWYIFRMNADSGKLYVDNCILEFTWWTYITSRNAANCNISLKNCYFVNMSGRACRRSGGVLDIFKNQDTLVVENCTHVMAQGTLYNFRDYSFKRAKFNHNTFINCSGKIFLNINQNNMSLTNNIFVNCNVQPYPGIKTIDVGEQDPELLPMGLVNVYPYDPNAKNDRSRKFYVDRNVVYWDSSLSDVVSTVNSEKVNGVTNWQSQMIRMNARTQDMFNDNAKYSLLTEGRWYLKKPNFTDPKDLFTTQLANLKEFSIKTVDTNSFEITLPHWRLIKTGPDNYLQSDWPIPVDLSYTNADLKTGGMDGLPVGDLNWFPVDKAIWNINKPIYDRIIECILLDCSTSVETDADITKTFQLNQNYPNPFNPATMISYSIPKDGFVTVKVFNTLGQEIAVLVNGFRKAQTYNVEFNASNLSGGIYFYQVQFENTTISKKMVLLK